MATIAAENGYVIDHKLDRLVILASSLVTIL